MNLNTLAEQWRQCESRGNLGGDAEFGGQENINRGIVEAMAST